jgi:D-sedoheptulose 7-phosphate isomerase
MSVSLTKFLPRLSKVLGRFFLVYFCLFSPLASLLVLRYDDFMSTSSMSEIFARQSADLVSAASDVSSFHTQVLAVARHLKEVFDRGGKVLVAGNGGSAAEAQHFSDEFVGKYATDRPAYAAIALTADGAVLTCVGNDYGFEQVFSRQVDALGKEGDVFIGLTTSGNSKNILAAAEKARQKGMTVVAMCGRSGTFKEMADFVISSPSDSNPRVQEMHLHAIHLLCECFEPDNIGKQL